MDGNIPEAEQNDMWKQKENDFESENQHDSGRRRGFYRSPPHGSEEGVAAALSDDGYEEVLNRGKQLLDSSVRFQANHAFESSPNRQRREMPAVSITASGYENVVTLGQKLLHTPVIYSQTSVTSNTNMPRVSHRENKMTVNKNSTYPSQNYLDREINIGNNHSALRGKPNMDVRDFLGNKNKYGMGGARSKYSQVANNDYNLPNQNTQSETCNIMGTSDQLGLPDLRNRVVPHNYEPYWPPNLPTYEQVANQRRPQKPVVLPDKFDGSIAWQDYKAHFELCAELNKWSSVQKANYLAVSLRGTAQELLGDMSSELRQNYQFLSETLCARFGSEGQTELFRTQLKSRQRKSGESLPELAQSIRRLVSRAYPEATTGLREILSKDCFIDALLDSDRRLRLKQSRPTSLDEAVKLAIELEAFQLAEDEKFGKTKKFVRMTKSEEENENKLLLEKIAELEKQVEKLAGLSSKKENQSSSSKNSPRKGNQSSKPRDFECWNCGKKGHMKFQCKEANNKNTKKHETKKDKQDVQEN